MLRARREHRPAPVLRPRATDHLRAADGGSGPRTRQPAIVAQVLDGVTVAVAATAPIVRTRGERPDAEAIGAAAPLARAAVLAAVRGRLLAERARENREQIDGRPC